MKTTTNTRHNAKDLSESRKNVSVGRPQGLDDAMLFIQHSLPCQGVSMANTAGPLTVSTMV